MGYACPVCETPQADAVHLANHLGFTAVVRGGDHEAWLDEHVPGWADLDEATLADRVVEHADEAEYPQVFEDTTGQADDRGRPHEHHDDGSVLDRPPGGRVQGTGRTIERVLDLAGAGDDDVDEEELQEVLERARELTRRRREDSETE